MAGCSSRGKNSPLQPWCAIGTQPNLQAVLTVESNSVIPGKLTHLFYGILIAQREHDSMQLAAARRVLLATEPMVCFVGLRLRLNKAAKILGLDCL